MVSVLIAQEEQLDAILCTAVETSSLGFITGCIKQWTTEGRNVQNIQNGIFKSSKKILS